MFVRVFDRFPYGKDARVLFRISFSHTAGEEQVCVITGK